MLALATAAWVYAAIPQPMDGNIKSACIESTDSVHQSAPFADTPVRLCVLKSASGALNVSIQLEQAGIIDSDSLRLKFDDNTPERVSFFVGGQGESHGLFVNPQDLIRRMGKHLLVEIPLYGNGAQFVNFDVSGFDTGKLDGEQ